MYGMYRFSGYIGYNFSAKLPINLRDIEKNISKSFVLNTVHSRICNVCSAIIDHDCKVQLFS